MTTWDEMREDRTGDGARPVRTRMDYIRWEGTRLGEITCWDKLRKDRTRHEIWWDKTKGEMMIQKIRRDEARWDNETKWNKAWKEKMRHGDETRWGEMRWVDEIFFFKQKAGQEMRDEMWRNVTRKYETRHVEKWEVANQRGQKQSGWPSTCSAQPKGLNPLSQVGQDGTKGAMWIWGFLGLFFSCVFRPLWVQCIKEKYVSGLDYRHNPSDHPAARHPAQPSLNRRLRWEVEDWVWTDMPAGKRETEAKMGLEVEWMGEQTEEFKCESLSMRIKGKKSSNEHR